MIPSAIISANCAGRAICSNFCSKHMRKLKPRSTWPPSNSMRASFSTFSIASFNLGMRYQRRLQSAPESCNFLHHLVDCLSHAFAHWHGFLLNGLPVSDVHNFLEFHHGDGFLFRHRTPCLQIIQGTHYGPGLS